MYEPPNGPLNPANDWAPAPAADWAPAPAAGSWGGQPVSGAATVALTTRYHPLAFVYGLLKPKVRIDGGPEITVPWGRATFPVPPGVHQIDVHVPYLVPPKIGRASASVSVGPNQIAEAEYLAPLVVFVGGALGPPPQRFPGRTFQLIVTGVGAAAVVVAFLAAMVTIIGAGSGDETAATDTSATTVPVTPTSTPELSTTIPPSTAPPITDSPVTSSAGSTASDLLGDAEPTLDETATPVSLLGPTYGPNDATFTMAFDGWPFAFRAPDNWDCIGGDTGIPEAVAWVCVGDLLSGNVTQRATVFLRPCPNGCGEAEQATLSQQWFASEATPSRGEGATSYLEYDPDAEGLYALDVSHFYPDPTRSDVIWQVGVYVQSPSETKDDVLKIVNDVLSQTSAPLP
ncbi:MAG: hypothetical protein ACK5RL_10680 [Acidimicrobiales bacterium]